MALIAYHNQGSDTKKHIVRWTHLLRAFPNQHFIFVLAAVTNLPLVARHADRLKTDVFSFDFDPKHSNKYTANTRFL